MPVVINSKFTPLTYDEITKPLIQETEAQQAMEDAYAETSNKAAELMAQANQQTDPVAYNRLKNYAEDLKMQADALMSKGLQSGSRRALLDMRTRYGQEIIPLENAAKQRQEWAKEQQQARLKNPNLRFQRDASTMSLADIAANPTMGYGDVVDLDDVSKKASMITTAFGKARQSISLGRNLDTYTQQIISQSGLSPEEIQAALNGDDSMLNKALEGLYQSTGVHTWSNNAIEGDVRNAIQQGAMLGIGDVNIKTQKDALAARRDEITDRNLQYASKFMKVNNDGTITFDTEAYKKWNEAKAARKYTTKTDGSLDVPESDIAGLSVKGDIAVTSDGTYVRKQGKNYYPIVDQEAAEKAFKGDKEPKVSTKTSNWVTSRGGSYISSFDEGTDYGSNSTSHFYDVMKDSDFLKNDGTWGKDVSEIDINSVRGDIKERLIKDIANSGLDINDFTIIRVDRQYPIDNDYFAIKTSELDKYKQDALQRRGTISTTRNTSTGL